MQYHLIDQQGNILRIIQWYDSAPPERPLDGLLQWVHVDGMNEPVMTEFQTAVKTGIRQNEAGAWEFQWEIQDWTEPVKQAAYTSALEEMYDTKAHERHYDNRFTCALRAGYTGPFQAEGTAFAVWMDNCNATAYSVMAQVLAGQLPSPSIEALKAMMPALVWPA